MSWDNRTKSLVCWVDGTVCRRCGDPLLIGQRIVRDPEYGWSHLMAAECSDCDSPPVREPDPCFACGSRNHEVNDCPSLAAGTVYEL
jgi:hypothetical protein